MLVASIWLFSSFEQQEKAHPIAPLDHFRKRFWRLFPWAFTAYLFYAAIVLGVTSPVSSIHKLLDFFVCDLGEIFLISMNGIATDKAPLLNGPAWTLSSILIVEFLIWCCLICGKKRYVNIIAPVSVIAGLGIWAHMESTVVKTWMGFATFGTFRTWIIYCAGYGCYCLIKKLSQIPFNQKGKLILTAIECFCHVFALWAIMNRTSRYYQWCVTILFVVAIAISLSGHSLINMLLSRGFLRVICRYMGEFSLSVYLTHGAVHSLFSWHFPEPEIRYGYKFYFIAVTMLCSLVHWKITPILIKLMRRLIAACKGKLIQSEQADSSQFDDF